MNDNEYRPRLIDATIEKYLSIFGAVCIEGPKWCGKTWTSSFHSNSQVFLGDPTGNFRNRRLAEMDINLILKGEHPRLLDEWQEVPAIWDGVRFWVDKTNEKGQYILTGSSTPKHKGILHSGAGRIATLRMQPMSLSESGNSTGIVSLKKLFTGQLESQMTDDIELESIIELVVRGGWPGNLNLSTKKAMLLPRKYIDAIINDDIWRLDGAIRNKEKMHLLLRALARNESTTASLEVLKKDITASDGEEIDANTVRSYLDVFNRLFLLANQPPFKVGARSKSRIRKAEKRHFVDPSLACALLEITPDDLLEDLETLGFMFEALCERDLRIYAEAIGGKLCHYQDYQGREIDAVVELPGGKWGAFEIKLGANQIETAAEKLLKIEEQFIDNKPSFLCIICGMSNAAYRREDGVFVVPITSLKE